MSHCVDVSDVDAVVKYLNSSRLSGGTKNIIVQAYRNYQSMYNLPELEIPKYHVKQKLPFFPLEMEIDSLINSSNIRLSCYLQLLKETGVRPIEGWILEWSDIDLIKRTVNIRTAKHGIPRILPVSNILLNRLGNLKRRNSHIFSFSGDPNKFDIELEHFTRNYHKHRKTLADKLQNPRLRQISPYTFRH